MRTARRGSWLAGGLRERIDRPKRAGSVCVFGPRLESAAGGDCVCLSLCLSVCLSHPPTRGGITLYLVVCVLRVRASAVACVASVPDGETPMQFVLCCLYTETRATPRDDDLTAKVGSR